MEEASQHPGLPLALSELHSLSESQVELVDRVYNAGIARGRDMEVESNDKRVRLNRLLGRLTVLATFFSIGAALTAVAAFLVLVVTTPKPEPEPLAPENPSEQWVRHHKTSDGMVYVRYVTDHIHCFGLDRNDNQSWPDTAIGCVSVHDAGDNQ